MTKRLCPTDMPADGKAFWGRYHDHFITNEVDYINFTLMCRNWALLLALKPMDDPKQFIAYNALNKIILNQQKAAGAASKKAIEAPQESLSDVLGKVLNG